MFEPGEQRVILPRAVILEVLEPGDEAAWVGWRIVSPAGDSAAQCLDEAILQLQHLSFVADRLRPITIGETRREPLAVPSG